MRSFGGKSSSTLGDARPEPANSPVEKVKQLVTMRTMFAKKRNSVLTEAAAPLIEEMGRTVHARRMFELQRRLSGSKMVESERKRWAVPESPPPKTGLKIFLGYLGELGFFVICTILSIVCLGACCLHEKGPYVPFCVAIALQTSMEYERLRDGRNRREKDERASDSTSTSEEVLGRGRPEIELVHAQTSSGEGGNARGERSSSEFHVINPLAAAAAPKKRQTEPTRQWDLSSSATRVAERGPCLMPPDDENSPSFHFWCFYKQKNDVAIALRDSGYYPEDGSPAKVSCARPRKKGQSDGTPCKEGYEYVNSTDAFEDGGRYGQFVRLEDEARARMVREFGDTSNLDEVARRRKAAKLSVKAGCQTVPDASVAGEEAGGPEKQLPISIDEYVPNSNSVGGRNGGGGRAKRARTHEVAWAPR